MNNFKYKALRKFGITNFFHILKFLFKKYFYFQLNKFIDSHFDQMYQSFYFKNYLIIFIRLKKNKLLLIFTKHFTKKL